MGNTDKSLRLIKQFQQVEAAGLSGSTIRGISDQFSDTDICIFVTDQLPTPDERKRQYSDFGISGFKYLDGDLEVCKIDGLTIDEIDYDFLWMSLLATEKSLRDLTSDFECDEYLPGGLLTVQPLFDPKNHIDRLRDLIPIYPDERAAHRVKSNIDKAYFSIYALDWPTKAPHRQDYFSFFFNQWHVFDYFITALFALNRQWRAHEKRIIDQIRHFDLAPSDVADRVKSIIWHQGENANLETNAKSIKQLFTDLTAIAQEEFVSIDLPKEWK